MIVHPPELSYQNNEVVLSAKIEYDHPVPSIPDRLWFAFPKDYESYLSLRSDPFAVALLQTSQYLGETLQIRGELSERLAYGLEQYGFVFHRCNPKWFNRPSLEFDRLVQPKPTADRLVVTAFSGGVDSFYTLFRHLPSFQPLPSYQIQAGLLIHGMDIRFYEADKYERIYATYQTMFAQLGLQLLQARMNAYLFWEHRLRWEFVHGAPLVATALCLSEKISRFYIPATHRYDHLLSNGTSPITDHWLYTETVEIIHHGSQNNRVEKLEEIAQWELPQKYLRVCTDAFKREDIQNCSQCNKCLRTMIMLDQLRVLDKFQTFNRRLTLSDWIKYILTAPGPTYPKQIFNLTRQNKRWLYSFFAWLAIQSGRVRRFVSEHLVNILTKEQLYKLKHLIYAKNAENRNGLNQNNL